MSLLQKAVFLDRDGVLIHDVHYLSNLDQIRFYPDVPTGLWRLQELGYRLIVVTNQSGVARGYFTEALVKESFAVMNRCLISDNVQLDGFYYCPHHPTGIPPYNLDCNCRKPRTGMIDQAVNDFGIDRTHSYMIGDKLCDIAMAVNAHLKGILLTTGYGCSEKDSVSRQYPLVPILSSFSQAVDWIATAEEKTAN